jgi:hypothetical protein
MKKLLDIEAVEAFATLKSRKGNGFLIVVDSGLGTETTRETLAEMRWALESKDAGKVSIVATENVVAERDEPLFGLVPEHTVKFWRVKAV